MSLLAQKSKSILESGRPPSRLIEVVREELEHDLLFGMPGCLLPKSVNELDLPESEVEQRAARWISVVPLHVLIPSDDLDLSSLWRKRRQSQCTGSPFMGEGSEARLTRTSGDLSQRKTPKAFAFRSIILPPEAAVAAVRRMS